MLYSSCTAVCPYAFYTVALDHMEAGKASILCSCEPVAAIKEPNVRHLGFIAIHGFVVREVPYLYLDENDIL